MNLDISRFKVVYKDQVLRALALMAVAFPEEDKDLSEVARKTPKNIEILAVNVDGRIEMIRDEAWKFQFLPA